MPSPELSPKGLRRTDTVLSVAARRTLPAVAALVLVAAAAWAFTGNRVPMPWREPSPFDALVAAVAGEPTRPVEGRLTGGFAYGRAPSRTRGIEAGSSAPASPNVRIAAARTEILARSQPTPANHAALGAARLALGDAKGAVASFGLAAEAAPRDARIQSDLAAAYLARAGALGRPEDWARALAAATRAIALDATLPEALFNRALALRGLSLPVEELAAWQAFADAEPDGPWSKEAAEHARLLRDRTGAAVPSADGDRDYQALREEVEDRLLPEWGAAVARGDAAAAARVLDTVDAKARELVAAGADTMPRDEVALVRRLQHAGDRRRTRSLADGHVLYGQARRSFVANEIEAAADVMARAAAAFAAAGSPYRHWQPVYRAFALRYQRKATEALAILARVPTRSIPEGYRHFRGRHAWAEGVMWGAAGRYDLEREPMTRAISEFRTAREKDYEIGATTLLAEATWFLGDQTAAWSHISTALDLASRRGGSTRDYHFAIGAIMASGLGLPEVALELLNARARVVQTPTPLAETLVQRATLLATTGRSAASKADLDRAFDAVERLPPGGVRDKLAADLEIASAEWFSRGDCRQAIARADAVYAQVAAVKHSIRTVGLLAIRARCRASLGDLAGAGRDLDQAAAVFESRRHTFASAVDRIQAFEQERQAFKSLVALEAIDLKDDAAALRTAERAREGVLATPLPAGFDPTAAGQLPKGMAVVYFESLDDRVLVWVLTHGTRRLITRPIGTAALGEMVARVQRAIDDGANVAELQPHSAPLFTALIAPALALADEAVPSGERRAVFFVPDGPLFSLPFGALPDASGLPLLRSRTIGVAPSLAAFLTASERLAGFAPVSVLAIGDGHDPASSGLPRLRRADAEAAAVGKRYRRSVVLKGADATKDRVVGNGHDVIHFAGHTVVNAHYPMFSRLLLAPNPASGDQGMLQGAEITAERFGTARVVMLATCEGAAGRLVEGEGTISIARTFFTAGVPAVVASLWPVADDLPKFAETFHEELIAHHDASRALRAAQAAALEALGPGTPVRQWGGFIMFGGLGSIH